MPQGADPGSPEDQGPATGTAPFPPAARDDDLETKPVLEWTKEDWSRWIARSPDEAAGSAARLGEPADDMVEAAAVAANESADEPAAFPPAESDEPVAPPDESAESADQPVAPPDEPVAPPDEPAAFADEPVVPADESVDSVVERVGSAEGSEPAGTSPEDVEWVTPEVAVPALGTDEPVDEEEPPEHQPGAEPTDAGEGGSDVVVAPDDRAPSASAPTAADRDDTTRRVEEAGRDRAAAELLEELAVPSSPPLEDGDPVADVPVDEGVPPVVGEVEPPPYPWFATEPDATPAPPVPPMEEVAPPPLAGEPEPPTTVGGDDVAGPQRAARSEPVTAEVGDDVPGPERAPLAAGPEDEWARTGAGDAPWPPAAAAEASAPVEPDWTWSPEPTGDDWSVDPGPGTTAGGTEDSDTDAPASWWSEATRAPAWPETAPAPPAAAAPPRPPVAAPRPADRWDARAGGERTAPRTSPVTAPRPAAPRPPEVRIERSHRVRSAFGLLGVAVLVGMVVAALITVAIFAISVALRRAIG